MKRATPVPGLNRPKDTRAAAGWLDYLAIMRLDHGIKHLFILPGALFAALLTDEAALNPQSALYLALTLLMALALASANYTINEWLDAPFDATHPVKCLRPAVQRCMPGGTVWAQYMVLTLGGLGVASLLGPATLATALCFSLLGLAYNVRPLRAKDRAFTDVLVESANNPIRFLMGWFALLPAVVPPVSLLLAYWFGGAFLMAAKRISEHRAIADAGGQQALAAYRPSFARYTTGSLLASALAHALICVFMMAVFIIKYRLEYMLAMPLVLALFALYMSLAAQPDSAAARPEAMLRQPLILGISLLTLCAFAALTYVDIPGLGRLASAELIRLPAPAP